MFGKFRVWLKRYTEYSYTILLLNVNHAGKKGGKIGQKIEMGRGKHKQFLEFLEL